MTGDELTAALIKYAGEIAQDATVIVFATTDPDGGNGGIEMRNASPYDEATVVHMATDMLVEDMGSVLDELDRVKSQAPAERPS